MKIIEVDTSIVEKEFSRVRDENPKYDIDDIVLKKIDFARDEKSKTLKKAVQNENRIFSSNSLIFEEMSDVESEQQEIRE
jgi:hypothetical protein